MPFLQVFPPLLTILVFGATMGLGTSPVVAQTAPQSTTQKSLVAPGATTVLGAPGWSELRPIQQISLAPLTATWNTLPDGQRRKWLALAQNYPNLAPSEQQKLHSRMAEWAALKPKDREQARLNFAETKKIAPTDLTANWEAYQALSPEERKKLASRATPKPAGAATVVKPVSTERLAEVPKVAKVPDAKRPLVNKPESLNRNTLLPNVDVPGAPQIETPKN